MNFRPLLLCLCFFSPWLGVSEVAAQRSFDPRPNGGLPGPSFATPAEADRAFGAATDLSARSRLVFPLTEAYLRAHRYEDLAAKLAAAPTTPADAGWQRGFLLAQLHSLLGNPGEAVRLLRELPENAARDPEVLKFRLAHPGLVGNPPEPATATLVEAPASPGERLRTIAVLLDALRPDLAMEIIAAHPDDLWNAPDALTRLAPQLTDQGLIPRLTPLLAARVDREPENWRLRLWLAHYQFLTGNPASAWDHLQRLRDQKDDPRDGAADARTPFPTLTERVAKLNGFSLWNLQNPGNLGPHLSGFTLQNARDVALICAGGRAAEIGEGTRFLHDLKATFAGDEAGWLTALMLLDSQGLVLRELRSQIARGTSSDVIDILALGWLNSHLANRQGMASPRSGRELLRRAFVKRVQSARAGPSAPGEGTATSAGGANGLAAEPMTVARGRMLANLEGSANATAALWEASRFLSRQPGEPDNEAVIGTVARLMVKTVAQADGRMAARMALRPSSGWYPPAWPPGFDPGRRWMNPNGPGGAAPNFPPAAPSVNEQVASAFIVRSGEFPWQPADRPPYQVFPEVVPAALPAALAKISAEPHAPDHAAARMAEAYVLSRVPGQAERAVEMLRQVTRESSSDVARFWLTAFLAKGGQYDQAAAVFTTIKPVPGYSTELLQGGVALLERAGRGEPPFSPLVPMTPERRTPGTTVEVLAELRRLVPDSTGADAPPPDPRALAIADQLSLLRPAETAFPERPEVLKVYQRFGKLPDQITLLEERTKRFPASADAWLALGDACSLAEPARSVPAYQTAFRLAPDRPDIAAKLVFPGFTLEERVAAYCVLLRKNAMLTIDNHANLLAVFQQANAWPRFTAAFGQGFTRWGRPQLAGNGRSEAMFKQVRQAAGDEIAIEWLTTMCRAAGNHSSYYSQSENALIALLTEKHRAEEITAVVDRILFPSEDINGLDVNGDDEPMSLLRPPDALDFIAKVTAPEGLARLKQHARQLMAESPWDSRAPLVLMTMLVTERDPTLSADLLPCLRALPADLEDGTPMDLAALAQLASVFPSGRPVTLELLAESRRRLAGKPAERETIEQLATTALDFGDRERAQTALREWLALAKSSPALPETQALTGALCLMARAGMEPEANELANLAFGPGPVRPGEGYLAGSSFPLTYLEACVEFGHPEFGWEAVPHFLRRLAVDAEDKSEQQRFPVDYPSRVVEALVSLDRVADARTALTILQKSWQASALQGVKESVGTAQRFLAMVTGESGPIPVAFVGPTNRDGGLTCWWDLAGMSEPPNGANPTRVNLLGSDLRALDGRYSVQILGGESPSRLVPIATIPNAPSRGEWRGAPPPGIRPASLRFTRVILTEPGGEIVIGPSIPASPGVERLRDPDLEQVRRSGDNTAQWTLAEGVLLTVPGPVPGRPGLGFVYKGTKADGEIRGERIPVRPGESFVQSAWLRAGERSEWGRRFLDGNGKELGTSFIQTAYGTRGWTLAEQRLEQAAGERVVGERIPPGTAFIEPVLRVRCPGSSWQPQFPARLAALSLRSLAPADGGPGPTDPATAAPDHLGPAENSSGSVPAPDKSRTWFATIPGGGGVVAVSPESDFVVVGGPDGTLHFLDYPSGKEVAAVHAHDDPVKEIAVLPAKAGAYSVDTVGNVHLVTLQPPADTLVVCTARPPSKVAFTPDRKWVIFAAGYPEDAAKDRRIIRVEAVDLATGKKVNVVNAPDTSEDLWVSPDGRTMFVKQSAYDPAKEVVNSWELPSFKPLPDAPTTLYPGQGHVRIPGYPHQTMLVNDAARDRFVTANDQAPLTVRRAKDRRLIWAFSPPPALSSLTVVPKDGTILTCSTDGTLWRYVVPE